MVEKISLILSTIRFLRPVQIIYQVYNKFRSKRNLVYFLKPGEVRFKKIKFSYNPPSAILAKSKDKFEFLNREVSFSEGIDWNYQGEGKLWNYNLQYLNFLHQEDIHNPIKQQWLLDLGVWLKGGKLPLEPYPVSLRIMNSIRYFSKVDAEETLLRDCLGQINYLSKNLEYHLLGNHLLENAFALFMGGFAFNNVKWIDKGKRLLYKELDEQILADGAHFELSPMYHQIILFRILELLDWYSTETNSDDRFLSFIQNKAQLMLSWLSNISFRNGDIPHFNDSANCIALTTNQLLEFANAIGIQKENIGLRESGYRSFVFDNYESKVDVAALGPSYQPGHGHADTLSFILYVYEKPLLVEQGTSTYENNELRLEERSTRAHNTVAVGDMNQSKIWHAFRVGCRASVNIVTDDSNILVAEHDGYKKKGVIHRRDFDFRADTIQISDMLFSDKSHEGYAYFHFHPSNIVKKLSDSFMINEKIKVTFEGALDIVLEDYKYSEGFNLKIRASRLKVKFNEQLETVIKL